MWLQLEGMGKLGEAQLDWLKQDLGGLKSSTPIVRFRAHSTLGCVSQPGDGERRTANRPSQC